MTRAEYWHKGETLDYKNTTDITMEENVVVDLNTRIGVTGTRIEPGVTGSLHVVGVFRLPKKVSEEITQGAAVFFDGETITSAIGDSTPAGYATETAVAADTKVLVKLLG